MRMFGEVNKSSVQKPMKAMSDPSKQPVFLHCGLLEKGSVPLLQNIMATEPKRGMVIGKPAPDFRLQDHTGGHVNLKDSIKVLPVMLVFYPADFTPVCTAQLCDYRDNMEQFQMLAVQIFGISNNDRESHRKFAEKHRFPFLLLSDPKNKVAKEYGCSSLFMLGNISRAVFVVNTKGSILYRYVEPTILSRRKSHVLLRVIEQLRENHLI